jgi:hypothetical protein
MRLSPMRGRTLSVLVAFLAIALLFGAAVARYLAYAHGDYLITASVPCDPTSGSCFVAECGEDTEIDCDETPYAKATLLAREAPACLEEHSCATFSCAGREACAVAFCSDDTAADGERCTDPSGTTQP